ncbi:MAG: chorismate synthase [Dehalococcoidales bacterium]|jgi:chorismate synthase|nr:chorismate synthase [Dehalococcoidales bacterium]
MKNSLGMMFTMTSFGESHGRCVGVVIDGCPAGLFLTEEDIQKEVDKRRPGTGVASTARAEEDKVEILSGTFNETTTGAPLCLLVWNRDVDSSQYERIRSLARPGHADYTAFIKYGGINDFRGGGRFSGRITATFVMAGAVAKKLLERIGVEVLAHTIEIGGIRAGAMGTDEIRANSDKNPLRCADLKAAEEMTAVIEKARGEGDSVGGAIEGITLNVPVGLGEPVFDTLEGDLSKALFAIPAIKGVEFGAGFSVAGKRGSENNDPFTMNNGKIVTTTNNAGGILGGMSNGMPIVLRVAVKPTPSISSSQETIDMKKREDASLEVRGRHDACIVPRAVPVVESMMAVTLCDLAMRAGLIPEVIK